jgi:ribosomal protein S12 methylthiotransferase
MIRGRLRSRPAGEIVQEARELVTTRGIKELVIIGQDTAVYGTDLEGQAILVELLKELDTIDGLEWIRLMYLHPAHITDRIIDLVGSRNKVVPYLDIPIQHASTVILNSMNRSHDYDHLRNLIVRLRRQIDHLALRTTVMLGFPGESNEDYEQLCGFVEDMEFDWLGAFVFNAEEDTPAYQMPNQVPEELKLERRDAIMKLQNQITRRKNMQRIDSTERILVSGPAARNLYVGRGYFQAPEVDGITMVKSKNKLAKGSMVDVKLVGIRDYDMIGEPIDEYTE